MLHRCSVLHAVLFMYIPSFVFLQSTPFHGIFCCTLIEMQSMRGCMRWNTTQQPNTPTSSGFGEKVLIEDTRSIQLLLLSRLFLNYLKYSEEMFLSSFATPQSFGTIYGLIRPRDLCIQAQMLIDVYGTLSDRLKTQLAFWFRALGLILGLTQTFLMDLVLCKPMPIPDSNNSLVSRNCNFIAHKTLHSGL